MFCTIFQSRLSKIRFFHKLFLTMSLSAFLFIPGSIFAGEIVENGSVYNQITSTNEIRVGISRYYPPLRYKLNDRPVGLEIDMAHELAAFLGVKLTLVPLEVTEYTSAIEQRRVDIVLAGMSKSLTRAKDIWFSKAYLEITPAVLADKRKLPQRKFGEQFEETPIKTLKDLKRLPGFHFGVKEGSAYLPILEKYLPGKKRTVVNGNAEGFGLLYRGEIDGMVHDSLFLDDLVKRKPHLKSRYVILKGGNRVEKIAAGLPFGDLIFLHQVNTFIDEIVRTGKITQWLNEH